MPEKSVESQFESFSDKHIAALADRLRPALNIYDDGLIRVSHGQDDIAQTVVRLVIRTMNESNWSVFLPPNPARFDA